MRCLLYSAVAVLLFQCRSEYASLAPAPSEPSCASRVRPALAQTSLYQASIDVAGHHLSGLLVIKAMPDSTWRAVFTNEAGVTFIDLGFGQRGAFTVHHAIRQLNRKPVLTTLRKDFALLIGLPFANQPVSRFTSGDEVYFEVKQKKESYYFITRKDCASLHRLERGSTRKRIVSVEVPSTGYPSPGQLVLKHHTFDMQIKLNRIERE